MAAQSPRVPLSVDPLIQEAKWRMRRRRILLGAVLAGAGALVLVFTLAPPHGVRPGLVRIASGGRVPPRVKEIDLQAPDVPSMHVTDPAQVGSIAVWFNGLDNHREALRDGIYSGGCAGAFAANVTFTFRSRTGAVLATAYSPPVPAGPCSPITFARGTQPGVGLVDPNPADSLIGQVQNLLGVTFRMTLFRG